MNPERLLSLLLRLAGGFMLLAVLAIFLPTEWMAATHRWLGLGEFPRVPLVSYLTRSAAALYALHGGLYLVIAGNLRRHRLVVRYVGISNLLFGAVMAGIDLHAGLPFYWFLFEAPPVFGFGLLVLWLLRSVPDEES